MGPWKRVPALEGHREVPESRGGPDAQGGTKLPSPGVVEGRERVLGGKMGHFSLPLLGTLTPSPTPPQPPGG